MPTRPPLRDRTNTERADERADSDCASPPLTPAQLLEEELATPLPQPRPAADAAPGAPRREPQHRTPAQHARRMDMQRARRAQAAARRAESKELDLLLAAHDCSGSSAIADAARFAHGK